MIKKLWIPISLILLLIASVWLIQIQEWKKQKLQISHDVRHETDTTAHWRDDYKTLHAENVVLQENLQTAQLLHSTEMQEAQERLKIKQKQIEGLQKVVATVRGRIITIVDSSRHGDTTASFIAQDPFATISGATVGNKETVDYVVRVPISLTPYWKRPYHFMGLSFGKIEHYIDGYSVNPNVVLDSLHDVQILSHEPGRWSLGPYIGVGFDGGRFTPSLGISINYALIRW